MKISKWAQVEYRARCVKQVLGKKTLIIGEDKLVLRDCVNNMVNSAKEAILNNPFRYRYFIKVLEKELQAMLNISQIMVNCDYHDLLLFNMIGRELRSIDYLRLDEEVQGMLL